MNEEIMDTRLQRVFRQAIKRSAADVQKMKALLYCGSRLIRTPLWEPGVIVLRNKESARYFGTTSCKNAWCCPVCSARLMSKYAREIAAAIDALKYTQNQVAIMVTLAIPHTSGMSCSETTEILFNTWKAFIQHGNKNSTDTYQHKKNSEKKTWKRRDPFSCFCEDFNCRHRVRVGEFTWGEHGWHPHFHCLFWVDADKLDEVIDYEDDLAARWLTIAQRETVKTWNCRFPNKTEDNKTRARIMYEKAAQNPTAKGVHISVDENGKARAQESSQYICGWGADKEVTGNVRKKATAENHMTPHQILQKAADTNDEKWLDLYMEFARTIREKRRARLHFSRGILPIIAEWKKTKEYAEVLKKKCMEDEKRVGKWEAVLWFTEEQWWSICFIDRTVDLRSRILELIMEQDGRRKVENLLLEYSIDIRNNREHRLTNLVLEMYNGEDSSVA